MFGLFRFQFVVVLRILCGFRSETRQFVLDKFELIEHDAVHIQCLSVEFLFFDFLLRFFHHGEFLTIARLPIYECVLRLFELLQELCHLVFRF